MLKGPFTVNMQTVLLMKKTLSATFAAIALTT
jgi:hypothetical protein